MIRWLLLASIAAILGLLAAPSALLYRGTLGYTALVPRLRPHGPPPPLIGQYLGLASDASNCGPASVAALLEWARPELARMDAATLVSLVRGRSGEPVGDTDQQGLARALAAFGVPVAVVPRDGAVIAERVAVVAEATLLDAGCGTGTYNNISSKHRYMRVCQTIVFWCIAGRETRYSSIWISLGLAPLSIGMPMIMTLRLGRPTGSPSLHVRNG